MTSVSLSDLARILGADPLRMSLDRAIELVQAKDTASRVRLQAAASGILEERHIRTNLENRRAALLILVSLLPQSQHLIRSWLGRPGGGGVYEVQFTLLALLSFLADPNTVPKFRRQVPNLVKQYLMHVRADTAEAAWMGGDLLANWPDPEALLVLESVASRARFPAGRKAALYGLGQRLSLSESLAERERILAALRKVQRSDSSTRVRKHARLVEAVFAQTLPLGRNGIVSSGSSEDR